MLCHAYGTNILEGNKHFNICCSKTYCTGLLQVCTGVHRQSWWIYDNKFIGTRQSNTIFESFINIVNKLGGRGHKGTEILNCPFMLKTILLYYKGCIRYPFSNLYILKKSMFSSLFTPLCKNTKLILCCTFQHVWKETKWRGVYEGGLWRRNTWLVSLT